MSSVEKLLQVGMRVRVSGKEVCGTVAYWGYPTFATGKWVGVVLDEPKGKNNGTIRGHAYFTCEENYGMFVRVTQLTLLDEDGQPLDLSVASPEETKASRSRLTSSRQSLAGSRQSLAGALQSPPEGGRDRTGTPETTNKRAAFVETNFVETLNPQFTPGQCITSPQQQAAQAALAAQQQAATSAAEDKIALLQAQQEIVQLKGTVEDLTEKLDTLRLRRLEDRERLKELERLRLQLEQMAEFKAKIMESQASLQRDLQRARAEAREAVAARDAHAEEMAELSETAEMAALDKEMAEEKAETLQLELDSCRERLEEALLDLQLLRAELDAAGVKEAGSGGAVSTYEVRQLEQQNARLRDTLVRLRDLSAHEKHHMQKMQKDLDQKKSEIAELGRTKEKLSARVEELEGQVADLQEQVDAALGAEEMVEQLGERKMALEDEVAQLKEEVSELEALQEVHEQLVESNSELQQDLREELDLSHCATREAIREREAALETVLDREQTIAKFRELVQRLTQQCAEYRDRLNEKEGVEASLESGVAAAGTGVTVPERQASTRAVDLQLRALQLRQALEHAALLRAYMPEHLMVRGGDHDAIMVLLLVPRMICKAEILLGQLREKFPAVPHIDRDTAIKSHAHVQFSFRCKMQFQLHMLLSVLQQYGAGVASGAPGPLMRCAGALPELAAQERPLDLALELLRTDRLDENTSTADLEKSYAVLFTMQPALLGPPAPEGGKDAVAVEGSKQGAEGAWRRPGEAQAVRAWGAAMAAACEALQCDGNVLRALLQDTEECAELQQLHELLAVSTETLLQQLKAIRRRLPADSVSLGLEPEWWERVGVPLGRAAWRASSAVQEASRLSCQAAALCEPSRLPSANLRKLWAAASDRHYAQDDQGPLNSVKSSLQLVLGEVATLAQFTQQQEYQIHATLKQDNKGTPPIVQRAGQVKKQLEETKSLTLRLENKEADLRELRRLLKGKQDEMSEMQIRKELAEKKLSSAARDQELQLEKLTRKLEDAHNQLKRKEKEFEETMDHLQQDIDSLELERGNLRDKLKMYGKKGERTSTAGSVTDGSSSAGEGERRSGRGGMEAGDSVQEELSLLHRQVEREREQRLRLEREHSTRMLGALTPLPATPARDQDHVLRLAALRDKFHAFQFEWSMFLAKGAVCQFPDEPAQYAEVLQRHREQQKLRRLQLQEKLGEIQREVREEFLSRRPWRSVDTPFAKFPSAELTRGLNGGCEEAWLMEYPVPAGQSRPQEVFASRAQLQQLRLAIERLGAGAACTPLPLPAHSHAHTPQLAAA